jgi:Uma2 family endonuclease
MTTQTLNYREAIAHLPVGGTLILTDVPWEEYEQLLADLGDSYSARITYDNGRLEIMSPSFKHENYGVLVARLADAIAYEMDIVLESLGSTTYKQQWLARGVEPDACFYVQSAARIIGNERIDLAIDPPPDIVVEIDVSHESTTKLKIYAGMRVPEVWRYDERRMHVHQLTEQGYVEVSASLAFPVLTTDALSQFLEQSKTEGQTATLRSFRAWLQAQRQ